MHAEISPTPRVARIEIHYEDGSKDEFVTMPKTKTEIPLFIWSRSWSVADFQRAYTNMAAAGVLFQTALTRRLMKHESKDENTQKLLREFAHTWTDIDYPPLNPGI
jgi:hypothetical protein